MGAAFCCLLLLQLPLLLQTRAGAGACNQARQRAAAPRVVPCPQANPVFPALPDCLPWCTSDDGTHVEISVNMLMVQHLVNAYLMVVSGQGQGEGEGGGAMVRCLCCAVLCAAAGRCLVPCGGFRVTSSLQAGPTSVPLLPGAAAGRGPDYAAAGQRGVTGTSHQSRN